MCRHYIAGTGDGEYDHESDDHNKMGEALIIELGAFHRRLS
jgi:hypothetical protein